MVLLLSNIIVQLNDNRRPMKEKLNHTIGIKSKQLLSQIASAQIRLYDKLINLDIKSLNISEYNQRYLGSEIAILKGVL